MKLSEFVKAEYGKSISECTNEELYYALLTSLDKGTQPFVVCDG